MVEQIDRSDAQFRPQVFRQSGKVVRREAEKAVDIRLPGPGSSMRQSNMVDDRDQRSVRAPGNGSRKRDERVQQETGTIDTMTIVIDALHIRTVNVNASFQIFQLNELIELLLGDLTKGERQKVNTICTIDVHCRDVVAKLIQQKIETAASFQWQSQLRHR
jgi:hypothetical protein